MWTFITHIFNTMFNTQLSTLKEEFAAIGGRLDRLTTLEEKFMSDVNQTLGNIKAGLTAQSAVIDELAGDIQELSSKVAELTAQIPDNALVAEIATLVESAGSRLRAAADVVPEPPPAPEV